MKPGKDGELLCLGTSSGKGYWTLCLSFPISLSVSNIGRGAREKAGSEPSG